MDVNVDVYCDFYYPKEHKVVKAWNPSYAKTNLTDEMQIVLDEFEISDSISEAAKKANINESIINDWIEKGKNSWGEYGDFYRQFKKIRYTNKIKRYSKLIANKKAENTKEPKAHDSSFNLTTNSSIDDIANQYCKKYGFNNWKYDKKNKDMIVFELVSADGKHVSKMKKVEVKYLMAIKKTYVINDEVAVNNETTVNDETSKVFDYVKVSSHRVKVVKSLHGDVKRVDEVVEDTGILPNHIPIILNDLKSAGIIEYIKEGNGYYILTELGDEIVKKLKIV